MAAFVSRQRVILGTRAFRVEFAPGIPVEVPDEHVDEVLSAGGGFGRRWLDLGVIECVEVAAPALAAEDADLATPDVAPARMEPTESQITRAVAEDEATVEVPEPPRSSRRRR